ncbi:hypothetical protein M1512_03230 [Patescibacteria group bacterium]|nr:hypothetical protein [Patescibacteria group bacterium]
MDQVENQTFVWTHSDGREVTVESYAQAMQMCAPFRAMVEGVVNKMTEGLPEEAMQEKARMIGESLFRTMIKGQQSTLKTEAAEPKPVSVTKTEEDKQKLTQPEDKPMQKPLLKVIEPKELAKSPTEQPDSSFTEQIQNAEEAELEQPRISALEVSVISNQAEVIQTELNKPVADFITPAPLDVKFAPETAHPSVPITESRRDGSFGKAEAVDLVSAVPDPTTETTDVNIENEAFAELVSDSVEAEELDVTLIKLTSQDENVKTNIKNIKNEAKLKIDEPLGLVDEVMEQIDPALICEKLASNLTALVEGLSETSLAKEDEAMTYDEEVPAESSAADIDTKLVAEVARALSELDDPETQKEVAELVGELSQAILINEESLLTDETIETEIYELTVKLFEILGLDTDNASIASFLEALVHIQARPREDYDLSSVDPEEDGTKEANNRLSVVQDDYASSRQVLPLLIGTLALLDSLRTALVA